MVKLVKKKKEKEQVQEIPEQDTLDYEPSLFSNILKPNTENIITYQEILNNLITDKDLELKTHIVAPKQLASLKIIADYFKQLELDSCSELLQNFIDTLNLYMVSYKRLSRKEIIKAISSQEIENDLDDNKNKKLIRNLR